MKSKEKLNNSSILQKELTVDYFNLSKSVEGIIDNFNASHVPIPKLLKIYPSFLLIYDYYHHELKKYGIVNSAIIRQYTEKFMNLFQKSLFVSDILAKVKKVYPYFVEVSEENPVFLNRTDSKEKADFFFLPDLLVPEEMLATIDHENFFKLVGGFIWNGKGEIFSHIDIKGYSLSELCLQWQNKPTKWMKEYVSSILEEDDWYRDFYQNL